MGQKISYEDSLTVVTLTGGITSANANEFQDALADAPGDTDGIVLDARELEFISSAGLRVILAAKKRCAGKTFRIINVSDDVMNVFEVTGFSEIMDISRARRKFAFGDFVKIGAGACGEVFRIDDETIIKLYYPHILEEEIEREKALSKKAFVLGIPTAISYDIVETNGRTGVIYELINSHTLGELMRAEGADLEKYVTVYADVCRQIHETEAKPGEIPTFKDLNRADIPRITGISEEEKEYLYKFLDLVPDRLNCIHGDLNLNNIMVQNGECCLIDMGEFSTGIPEFDISRIVFSMEFAAVEPGSFNSFYKMPQDLVTKIMHMFLNKYYGVDSLEEAIEKNPDVAWLYPLAWFRCCTSFLKGGAHWPEDKRPLAERLLREKLIPFVQQRCGQ